ncbi:MAG: hypothetical protein ACRCTS_08860 [Fusobacteriaceae bacterium]
MNKNIGLDKKYLETIKKLKVNVIQGECFYLHENIILFRDENREKSPVYNRNGEGDDFSHELQLIINENDRLNIITGCSHSGIENIVSDIRKTFPDKNINSILGGLHTRSYFLTPWKLFSLIKFLNNSSINHYYLGHCTGNVVRKILKKTIKNVFDLEIGRWICI